MNLSVTLITLLTAISYCEEDKAWIGCNVSRCQTYFFNETFSTKPYASLKSVKVFGNIDSHLFASQTRETFSFAAFWLRWTRPHCHVFRLSRDHVLVRCSTKAALCRWYRRFVIIFWHSLSFSLWLCLLAFLSLLVSTVDVCISVCGRSQPPDPHYYWPPSCQWTEGTQASTQLVAGHSTRAGISTGKLTVHCSESTTEHKCCQKTCHPLIASSSGGWLDAWNTE